MSWRLRLFAMVGAVLAVAGCTPSEAMGPRLQVRAGSVCSSAVAAAPNAAGVTTSMASTPGSPFGVAASRDGRWVFVSTDGRLVAYGVETEILHRAGEVSISGEPGGVALTSDGRYVLVATGHGAVVIDAQRAQAGAPGAMVATMESPTNDGATEVAVSSDSRYAFVTFEKTSRLAVFALDSTAVGSVGGRLVGTLPLGRAPVGLALSPDSRWLYVTSQSPTNGAAESAGILSVLDVVELTTDPTHAVVATVEAGCSPVRVVVSMDGAKVWVSARGSNAVLALWADRLGNDPGHALAATVPVGQQPVGLAIVGHDRWLVVADSNRSRPQLAGNLAVVDAAAGLAGQPALRGYAPAGRFPRDVAPIPGEESVVVSNYDSQQVELVDLTQLR